MHIYNDLSQVLHEPHSVKTKDAFSEMFAFAESLKRQETKLISPNANISLLSITVSAVMFDNVNCICYIQLIPTVIIKVIDL